MPRLRPTTSLGTSIVVVALALAACGGDASSPPAAADTASPEPSPSVAPGASSNDLSAIACSTDEPADAGPLTGVWEGDDTGVYYIRQVGDCIWWFGTELREIERGATGQPGFANVAAGYVDGDRIVVEWADVPMGNVVNGGGLTLTYDAATDRLTVTERRGTGQVFGGTRFVRFEPEPNPDASPSAASGG